MSKRKKVIPTFKELKEDLKTMTFKEKVDHLWTYYSPYLWGVGLAAVVIAATISGIINKNREVLVSGFLINVSMEQQGYNYLSSDYFEKLGGKERKQSVDLSSTNFAGLEDPTNKEDYYYETMELPTMIAASLVDYVILDDFAMRHYLGWEEGIFLDLRECLSQEEMAFLQENDMLAYSLAVGENESLETDISEDDPRRYPVAIKLQNTDFGKDNMGGRVAYFVIPVNADVPAAAAIWEHIKEWK